MAKKLTPKQTRFADALGILIGRALGPMGRRQESTDALLVDLVARVEVLETRLDAQAREAAPPKLRQIL